jgi:ubiquinone/menaquinone biosynthesis C-methylase UbiE
METKYLPIRELYQAWSACYDTRPNPLTMAEGKVLRALVGDVRGKKVLDLGCGTGRHAIDLAKAGGSVTGVDFSEGMLAAARGKAGGLDVRFLEGHLDSIPLHEPFDLVVCSLVLNHVESLLPCFREMSRLLQPDGRIIVTDLRSSFWSPKRKVIPLFHGLTTDSFKHTLADYKAATRAAGLSLKQRRGIRFDREIIARYPGYFHLWFLSAGYAFDIRKAGAPGPC